MLTLPDHANAMKNQEVIIIGAGKVLPSSSIEEDNAYSFFPGVTGLLIAQGLSKVNDNFLSESATIWPQPSYSFRINIRHSIYEADSDVKYNGSCNWGMGIHWPLPMLRRILPPELYERIQEVQTEPFTPASQTDFLPLINGEKGAELGSASLPRFHKKSRARMRALCAEGLRVQVCFDLSLHPPKEINTRKYNKRLVSIRPGDKSDRVTASFADGTSTFGTTLIGADGVRSIVRRILLAPRRPS